MVSYVETVIHKTIVSTVIAIIMIRVHTITILYFEHKYIYYPQIILCARNTSVPQTRNKI